MEGHAVDAHDVALLGIEFHTPLFAQISRCCWSCLSVRWYFILLMGSYSGQTDCGLHGIWQVVMWRKDRHIGLFSVVLQSQDEQLLTLRHPQQPSFVC